MYKEKYNHKNVDDIKRAVLTNTAVTDDGVIYVTRNKEQTEKYLNMRNDFIEKLLLNEQL